MSDAFQHKIECNLELVERRISDACARAGRQRDQVTLVVVSKTRSVDEIEQVLACGICHLGENRIEELQVKVPAVARQWKGSAPVWHMIGHLQSRKAGTALQFCQVLHSLDSISLAEKLEARALNQEVTLPVLVECNVSGEETKYGFKAWDTGDWQQLAGELAQITTYRRLSCRGLMTMAPVVNSPDEARVYFRRLRELNDFLRQAVPGITWQELSMGMSDDFEVAIEEGATMVRIGRAIFG